jgi:hypothetical protein
MGRGLIHLTPCEQGGMNHSLNIDAIPPVAMVHPTRNLNLHEGGRTTRGGTSKINATAISDAPQIMGIYDFIKQGGVQNIVLLCADGKLYKSSDLTTALHTFATSNKYPHFEIFEDTLFVCNGANRPQTWDGLASSTSNITSIPTDWTGTNHPIQLIAHGKGNSRRLWAILSSGVYASALGNGNDFSNANVIYLPIESESGLIGGVEWGDRLIVFSKNKAFIIDDEDTNTANWGYYTAQWNGGAANFKLIIKTINDIVGMSEDGEIYSIGAVQDYGDYKKASLLRPSFMNRWIKENVNLTRISQFHGVFDPILNALKIFVVRAGKTTVDTALLYYINRPVDEAWMVHDAIAGGYLASCSGIVLKGTGNYKCYTGDYAGFLWELETNNANDGGLAFYNGFTMPYMAFGNSRLTKYFQKTKIIATPKGNYNLYMKVWVDGTYIGLFAITLAGIGGVLNSFLLDTDILGGGEVTEGTAYVNVIGKRIKREFYINTVNQTFEISAIIDDYKIWGARA